MILKRCVQGFYSRCSVNLLLGPLTCLYSLSRDYYQFFVSLICCVILLHSSPAGEIDRCLKKVAEGVEQFEDIWQKVRKDRNK